jgi:hypothetical protein
MFCQKLAKLWCGDFFTQITAFYAQKCYNNIAVLVHRESFWQIIVKIAKNSDCN